MVSEARRNLETEQKTGMKALLLLYMWWVHYEITEYRNRGSEIPERSDQEICKRARGNKRRVVLGVLNTCVRRVCFCVERLAGRIGLDIMAGNYIDDAAAARDCVCRAGRPARKRTLQSMWSRRRSQPRSPSSPGLVHPWPPRVANVPDPPPNGFMFGTILVTGPSGFTSAQPGLLPPCLTVTCVGMTRSLTVTGGAVTVGPRTVVVMGGAVVVAVTVTVGGVAVVVTVGPVAVTVSNLTIVGPLTVCAGAVTVVGEQGRAMVLGE